MERRESPGLEPGTVCGRLRLPSPGVGPPGVGSQSTHIARDCARSRPGFMTPGGGLVGIDSSSTQRDFSEGHCVVGDTWNLLGRASLEGEHLLRGQSQGPPWIWVSWVGVLSFLCSGYRIVVKKITFGPRCMFPTGGLLSRPSFPAQKSLTCPVQMSNDLSPGTVLWGHSSWTRPMPFSPMGKFQSGLSQA